MKKRILQTITLTLLCQVLSFPVAYGAPPKKAPQDSEDTRRGAVCSRAAPSAADTAGDYRETTSSLFNPRVQKLRERLAVALEKGDRLWQFQCYMNLGRFGDEPSENNYRAAQALAIAMGREELAAKAALAIQGGVVHRKDNFFMSTDDSSR